MFYSMRQSRVKEWFARRSEHTHPVNLSANVCARDIIKIGKFCMRVCVCVLLY